MPAEMCGSTPSIPAPGWKCRSGLSSTSPSASEILWGSAARGLLCHHNREIPQSIGRNVLSANSNACHSPQLAGNFSAVDWKNARSTLEAAPHSAGTHRRSRLEVLPQLVGKSPQLVGNYFAPFSVQSMAYRTL